ARETDVPHAAPGQYLDGVPLAVRLRQRLVNRAHAALAESVHQREWAENEALRLALQQPIGLEASENGSIDEEIGEGGRLGVGVLVQVLADDLVQLAAIQQVAAAQVPDKPFTGSEVGRRHVFVFLATRGTGMSESGARNQNSGVSRFSDF